MILLVNIENENWVDVFTTVLSRKYKVSPVALSSFPVCGFPSLTTVNCGRQMERRYCQMKDEHRNLYRQTGVVKWLDITGESSPGTVP